MSNPDHRLQPASVLPDEHRAFPAWKDWRIGIAILLIAAGLALSQAPQANTRVFLAINALGPSAPLLWSSLSVAGLGLCAFIYLSAFAQDRPGRVARLGWILLVGGLVIHFIKRGFATPRPLAGLGDSAMTVVGASLRTHSMPSGHAAMAFAMFGLLAGEAVARPTRIEGHADRLQGAFWLPGWGVLALGIAISRVAVGAHWPADVLVGAGLGLAFSALSERAWPVDALTRQVASARGCRILAIVLAACAAAIAATPSVVASLGLAHTSLAKSVDTGYPMAEWLQWVLASLSLTGAVRWWMAGGRATASG